MHFEKLKLVEGQPFANRARFWIYSSLLDTGADSPRYKELKGISRRQVYNFVSNGKDMTLSRLEMVANSFEIPAEMFLMPIPEKDISDLPW